MLAIDCGIGPWVLIEAVKCMDCGEQKLYVIFNDDPSGTKFHFPFIGHKEWAEQGADNSACVKCHGGMLYATRSAPNFKVIDTTYLGLFGAEVQMMPVYEVEILDNIGIK